MRFFFVCVLIVSGCGTDPEPLEPVMANYIEAAKALAADDYNGAKKALMAMEAAAQGKLKALVQPAAAAEDIGQLRDHFKPLSDQMATQPIPKGFGLAYCPMVQDNLKGYWIQAEGEILNPYFGASMLHCGAFQE